MNPKETLYLICQYVEDKVTVKVLKKSRVRTVGQRKAIALLSLRVCHERSR